MKTYKALKAACVSLALLAPLGMTASTFAEEDSKTDATILMALIKQARTDLNIIKIQKGMTSNKLARELREGGESREARGEHRGERAGRESRGEHRGEREGRGERSSKRERSESHNERSERNSSKSEAEGGEEGGNRIGKYEKWDRVRNGARLILAYNPSSQSFKGYVHNTTKQMLPDVRVEVHLSNGTELGPTKRVNLKPGAKLQIELAANNQKFAWWTTHPEYGIEEGHGSESEESGEHSGMKNDKRPQSASLRPVYNQLQLLCKDIEAMKNMRSKSKR
ncbi:hypothetical protein KS4_16720 [Poriferisphaera corsica]|uniref:Uncharacterized protein n=1 Tax=Poriferisphaera corsica TaxID=2528020 RepID=A0A517YTR9_9BACT|nr:hypothetical protein [Poriferisphaera corsica]QDU33620.1 hypothetical protein KS4_16720 [Poriferisphaera corsica]